jgi:putative pyruvate formate lyase activating enzyme
MAKVPTTANDEIQPAEESRSGSFEPAYLKLLRRGRLSERARLAESHLEDCDLCARYCHVNRRETIRGAVCRTGQQAVIYSYGPHQGEEDVLRGWRGSGTIFFSWCNLRCVFCQNWEISWKGQGHEVSVGELADMMLELQEMGCFPLVYNTGGYDSIEALALLDGIVDIYMPDMKYGDSELAKSFSHVKDYVRFNRAAVREMHRQVGDLQVDPDGLARRGLLVRHLILPNGIAGTEQMVKFLAEEVSPNTYINLMDQYRPCYRAGDYPELDRPITVAEYQEALDHARESGLVRLDECRSRA